MYDIEQYLLWEMDARTYVYTKEKVLKELNEIEALLPFLALSDHLNGTIRRTQIKIGNRNQGNIWM